MSTSLSTPFFLVPKELLRKRGAKHLSGQHDQSSHGRAGARTSSGAARSITPTSDTPLGGGVNETRIIEYDDNGTMKKGVFKPTDGERTVYDIAPAGTQASREVAASIVDEEMGLGMTPRSEMVEIDGREGSLSEWINSGSKLAADVMSPAESMFDGNAEPVLGTLKGVDDMVYYDALIGNSDRHEGNWLIKDGAVKLIDNGTAFGDNLDYVSTGTAGGPGFRTLERVSQRRLAKKEMPYVAKQSDKFKEGLEKLRSNRPSVDDRLRKAGLEAIERESFWKRADALAERPMLPVSQGLLGDLGRAAESKSVQRRKHLQGQHDQQSHGRGGGLDVTNTPEFK